MAKHAHLTLQDRSIIQAGLASRSPIKQIAEQIGKDPTTVAKEIKNHAEIVETGSYGHAFNPCKRRKTCDKTHVCERCTRHGRKCAYCGLCNQNCADYEEEICPKLSKSPYVCNGCSEHYRCVLRKREYKAVYAQKAYEEMRSESRKGLAITPEELIRIDDVISPLVKQGQSIHHICVNNQDEIMLSERCIYRYMDYNLFSAGVMDLPRKVRMRPRKTATEKKVDRHCHEGRTYKDFQSFIADNPEVPIVEMDSVIGRVGGKVLLTIYFKESSLMLAFLRDRNTARSVTEVMNYLYELLGRDLYCRLFPVILMDRGSEFSNPLALEYDQDEQLRSLVFYCDPSSPYQKGGCEVCHEFIRRILPKGTSFDSLQQADIDLMFSHINSYKREKLNNRSAHQLFSFLYGNDVLRLLNLTEIEPNKICLTPKLLK